MTTKMRWALLLHNALFATMLASALWRGRAVPPWAAVAVGAFPIFGLALSPAGATLAVAGFGACALTLRRAVAKPSPADTSAPVTPART